MEPSPPVSSHSDPPLYAHRKVLATGSRLRLQVRLSLAIMISETLTQLVDPTQPLLPFGNRKPVYPSLVLQLGRQSEVSE